MADIFLDNNGTTPGFGTLNAINWDVISSLWSTSAVGTASPSIWNPNPNTTAVANFGSSFVVSTTSGTITIASGLTIGTNGLTSTNITGTQTIAAGNATSILSLVGTTPTITTNGATLITISAQVSGTAGLTKAGPGTLSISGTTSNYTGGFTMSAGIFRIGTNAALGAAANTLALNGGTIVSSNTSARAITAAGASTIGGDLSLGDATNNGLLTFSNAFSLGSAPRILTLASDVTFTGIISNSGGGLTKAGAGTLVLTGANTFTGAFGFGTGTVRVGNAGALGAAAATLSLSGGTLTSNSTSSYTLTNAGASFISGDVTFGAAVTYTGTLTFTNSFNLGGATRTLTTLAPVVFQTGVISNGGITKEGASSLTLSGANTFTGAVTINTGSVTVSSATGLGAAASTTDITVASGAALTLISVAQTYSSRATKISGAGVGGTAAALFVNTGAVTSTFTVALQAAATIGFQSGSILAGTISTTPVSTDYALTAYVVSSSTGTISAIISGGGALNAGISTAIGTLTLSNANTFSGSVLVNYGTLSATNASALGTSTPRDLTVASGAALSLGQAIANSSFSTTISGTGVTGVNPTGNGAIILAFTGTVNIGTITLAAASSIRITAAGTLTGTITNAGFALTLQAAPSTTGTISAPIGGSGALIVGDDAFAISQTGTVTLSSLTNSYSGNTTVSTGTLAVIGLLGSGSYAGTISIASGATFSFTSAALQTLSGNISGLGTLTKATSSSSILTLSGTNSYSALNIQAGTVSVASIATNIGSGVSTINFGLTSVNGTLRYTGSGETTSKVINLTGNTTGGAGIENNGSGALVVTSNITGVSASGTRTLTLSGSNGSANDFQGIIADVGGGAGLTAFTKAGSGYWKLTGVNTFSGVNAAIGVSVTGGILEIPALTALGSGTKTISVTATNRNGSMLLSGAVTYSSSLSWSLASSGQDQTNNPLGAIRATAATVISGTVAVPSTAGVYAETADITLNGLITGSASTFGTRAAAGRTITIAGGFGNTTSTLFAVGPGTTVWNGSASNTTTTPPVISGGTLKMVTTTSTATLPLQFAVTFVSLGQTASQANAFSSRYQYTGGTLELSNSGAAGAVGYTGLSSTSAINLVRGSGKVKLSRDSTAGSFNVTLGNSTSSIPASGVLTLEYAGTTGTIGTDSSIVFSALGPDAAYARIIISDGAGSFVPAYFDANRVAVPMVYGSAQSNVAASQGNAATIALVSSGSTFGNYNLTGAISAQVSARTSTLRFDSSTGTPVTLAAGANFQSVAVMDMGTGTARTIIAGATGAKFSRHNLGGSGTFSVWTQNVTSTGATISADMDARYAPTFMKAGVGILTLSGKVENLTTGTAFQISEGTVRIGSTGTFNNRSTAIVFANVYDASPTTVTVAAEFNQAAETITGGVSGGGANTRLTLNGGDLAVGLFGTAYTFGGDIVLSGSQKLKVRSTNPTPETAFQAFQGVFPFTAIESTRGYISLDPMYGATINGTPSITVTGGTLVAIQATSPLSADYTVALGALSATNGALRVTQQNATASTNVYASRITATSIAVSGDGILDLLGQTANALQTFTIAGATTGQPLGSGVNVFNGSNIAFYRAAGQTLSGGGTASVNTVDAPIYGAAGDANFPAAKTVGTSFTSSATDNISVTGAQSSQTSQTMRSLRSTASITMSASNQRLTTDLLLTGSAGVIIGASANAGELATQSGNLYVTTRGGSLTINSTIVNGTVPTTLILYSTNALTLSGTNSHSGGTSIVGGGSAISINNTSAFGSGSIYGNGGQGFTLNAALTTLSLANNLVLNDGGLRLDVSSSPSQAMTLSGTISGAGPLFLSGTGSFTINPGGASHTANGQLNINTTGTVTVNAALAFTDYEFTSTGTFQYGTGITTDISPYISTRGSSTLKIDTNGNDVTWGSSVGNASNYTKLGAGAHTLSAENFFFTATISTGTVKAGNVGALGYGAVTLAAGTVLQTLTAGGQNGKLTLTGTFTNSAGGTIRIGG